jgi:hypothetical protein
MSATPCVRCGRPTADGYACHGCAQGLAQVLTVAAGHAEDAEAVLARQTRYGAGGRGGNDEPLPVDLTAATRYRAVENAIGGWARHVSEATGDAIPPPVWPTLNTTAIAAQYLAARVGQLRGWPEAGEAFKELHDTCAQLSRLVDRPADRDLVGMCDCGKTLYAASGRTVVQCPAVTCKLVWNVAESRDILRRALDGKLVTASEAARLAAYLDGDRTQDAIRKLIASRAAGGQLGAHGQIGDEPAYRFGEVVAVLATIQRRRTREGAAA